MIDYLSLIITVPAGAFTFALRGKSGQEIVVIRDGSNEKTITLTTKDKVFSAHNNQITMQYTNDSPGRDAYFQSNFITVITSRNFEGWNCSTSNENHRCESVRKGVFAWRDTYTVNFYGTVQNLILSSLLCLVT